MRKLIFIIILICAISGFSYANTTEVEKFDVKSGDTLSTLLSDRFTSLEINQIQREIKQSIPNFVLRAGTLVEKSDEALALHISLDKEVRIFQQDNQPKVMVLEYEQDIMPVVVTGVIHTTLFDAVRGIGEDAELAATLARIYEWEVDFFRDIRPGDRFTVLVEKRFIKDQYAGYGRILAAEFNVRGKTRKAFYFSENNRHGYYDEKGRSLERGFLRVPLAYGHITSRFTDNRLHPVLGVNRPHYGVDYAAPIGTPVMVTGTGTIEKMSYNNASGKFITVRHSNGYRTYYLHLNSYNKNLREGSSVNQGEVIGYVGRTGYATGPHLDYRIQKNSSWLNPLTFIAETPKLNEKNKPQFNEQMAVYADKIIQNSRVAGLQKPVLIP